MKIKELKENYREIYRDALVAAFEYDEKFTDESLLSDFNWEATRQGHAYWAYVVDYISPEYRSEAVMTKLRELDNRSLYISKWGSVNAVPKEQNDPVNKPSHYTDGKIEVIHFIEDKKLGFHLGNTVKYVARAGKKDPSKELEDLKKAAWYLNRRIANLEKEKLAVE